MLDEPRNRALSSLALCATLALAWLVYSPGLGGGFLFDDFVNLSALGSSGAIDSWPAFWRYLTSGTADPTGRPLALLSFLMDARNWPADPAPFLRTNLSIHLVNGALLFVLLTCLQPLLSQNRDDRAPFAPLLASALWVLHPLFVSTTLYIVQREAMLPATFVLLGLIVYTRGRQAFIASLGRAGTKRMAAGIVFGTVLATLCKANGMLLPMLAWVLEATVFRLAPASPEQPLAARKLLRLRRLLLVAPSLAVLAYVAYHLADWSVVPPERTWTIGQRVMTEPRILMEYLGLLFVPRSMSSGLFNDHYVASTSLLDPVTTLVALASVLLLAGGALCHRDRYPVAAAAVLFFLVGHMVESTAVPLELYFEHRNYLPALLLFWPVANAVVGWKVRWPLRLVAACALVSLLALTTWQRARLWGEPDRQAAAWVAVNPDSSRAQAVHSMYLLQAGRPQQAMDLLRPRWRARPDDLQLALSFTDAACRTPAGPSQEEKQWLAQAIRDASVGQALLEKWLARAAEQAAAGLCPLLTLDDVEGWVRSTGKSPATRARADQVRQGLLGTIELYRDRPDSALAHFDRNLATNPTPETAAVQSSQLASRGYFRHALAHLDRYETLRGKLRSPGPGMPSIHATILQWQGYWPREMRWLRSNFESARDNWGDSLEKSR